MRFLCVVVGVIVLTACGAEPAAELLDDEPAPGTADLVVAGEAVDRDPLEGAGDQAAAREISTDTDAAATIDDGLSSLLITADEVPGWNFSGVLRAEPSRRGFNTGCRGLNAALNMAERKHHRVTGTVWLQTEIAVEFTQYAVAPERADTTKGVFDAIADTDECPGSSGIGGIEAQSFAYDSPSSSPTAGLVFWSDYYDPTTIVMWPRGEDAILVRIHGLMSKGIRTEILDLVDARLSSEGADDLRAVAAPSTALRPVVRPSKLDFDPGFYEPATYGDEQAPEPFPPAWANWTEHDLARVVPDPDTLGWTWALTSGAYTPGSALQNESAVSCSGNAVEALPPVDTLSLMYEWHGKPDSYEDPTPDDVEATVVVGEGSLEDVESYVRLLAEIARCDRPATVQEGRLEYVDWRVFEGADSSASILFTHLDDRHGTTVYVLGIGQYGDRFVLVGALGLGHEGSFERAAYVGGTLAEHVVARL